MAIKVPYRLDGLKDWAEELELDVIPSGKNGRFMAEDYIGVIRDYYLKERYGDNIPPHMILALKRKSPMLAQRIDKYNEEFQQYVEESDDYFYEEKLNGMRALLTKDSSGIYLYSRHNSSVDLLPVELSSNVLRLDEFNKSYIDELNSKHPLEFQIDCELDVSDEDVEKLKSAGLLEDGATKLQAITTLMNSTPERALKIQTDLGIELRFNAFDCITYKGKIIDNLEITKRKKGLAIIKEMLDGVYNINIENVRTAYNKEDKESLLKEMILTGKEGIVAKRIDSTYRSDGNRDENWVKIKPSVSYRNRIIEENNPKEEIEEFNGSLEDLGVDVSFLEDKKYGDTIDAFITGFQEGRGNFSGLIGSVELSTFIVKENGERYLHPIAWISGFDKEMREDMTIIRNGNVALKDSYYNNVWEIDGQGISHSNLRLNHARLIQVRLDKTPAECETPEKILSYVL